MINILCVGDVVGSIGCLFLRKHLPVLKRQKAIDLCIVNGENSADGNGITPNSLRHLLDSGADVVTTGNHSFRRRESYACYAPGRGLYIADLGRVRVAVMNLMGTVYMESLRSPFETLDALLETPGLPKIRILDFHAEATGEKRALGFYADGRLSAQFGTHTHVPTADEGILPKGTGYISDVGMTGTIQSVLGVKPEIIIGRYTTKMPARFDLATGPCKLDCVIFTVDEGDGLCKGVERLTLT